MKEFWRKYKFMIKATAGVILLFWLALISVFYFFDDCCKYQFWRATWESFKTNILSGLITAFIIGLFLYKLDSSARKGMAVLSQRIELKKRALDCFEKINKLIIKIRFYNTLKDDGSTIKDIRISFDQMANFFVELQKVYKKLPGVIPDDKRDEIDKLDKFYQGWERYFTFEKSEDLEKLKESVKCAEGYLTALKKALINFIDILRFE